MYVNRTSNYIIDLLIFLYICSFVYQQPDNDPSNQATVGISSIHE